MSLTNEDVQVRIYGDTAIVTGRIVQKAERPGQDSFSFQSRFTDFIKGIPAQFIILRDEKGQVARVVVLQDGRTIPMKRTK